MSASTITIDRLQNLLDKVGVIDFQYEKIRKKNKFNIFNLIAKKHDEVNLHSKFIHDLLNPKGSHGHKTLFLEQFLETLQITTYQMEDVEVVKEYRNIDILIRNRKRQAIVIENKLWAADQPAQLERYYNTLLSEGYNDIKIFYLSIKGKDPSEYSVGELSQLSNWSSIYTSISYRFEIDQWIESCIKEAYMHPTLRETLIQYKSLINDIAGKTMNHEERHEILDLIAQQDNVLRAKKIAENWVHVKWHTEWDFWNDLDSKVSQHYPILQLQKYSSDKLNSVVHQSRNRNYYYGIMFKIGEYKGDDACIFIERGEEEVYYGLTIVRENSKRFCKEEKFAELVLNVGVFSEWGWSEHWIGGNTCQPPINFNSFSNETTLRLIQPDFRENYINNLWLSINQFTEQCKLIILSDRKAVV